MKRKFFATLALFILVLAGAFSPVFGLLGNNLEPKIAYAEDSSTSTATTAGSSLECGANVLCGLVTGYVAVASFLPHLFAELSGLTLDWVVWKNIQSETWTSQDAVDSFVVKGWKLVRDFSNLFFIFALFLVAFSLILNSLESETRGPLLGLDPKRTIAQVILMALLINFSFFMCRVIIDTSNLFARVFYNKITIVETTSSNGGQSVGGANRKISMGSASEFLNTTNFAGIRSISLGILNKINPQEFALKNTDLRESKEDKGNWFFSYYAYDWSVYILLLFTASVIGLFNIFLIYLFASSAMFLISRIYGLFFLVILSPIAFISTAIPWLKSKDYFGFDDWFKQLTGLAFSLPIYLFFMYLAIFFIDAGEKIKATTVTGYIGIAAFIIIKLVSMGAVLIIGKKVSKDLSGRFGAMASGAITGIVTGAAMVAGAAMTGGASAALRMGGQVARRGAISVAEGVGGAVIGDEKVQQLQNWIKNSDGSTMRRLNNFNPMRDMKGKTLNQQAGQFFRNFGAATSEAARIAGSEAPDKITKGYATGSRYGTMSQIQSINKKLIEANKKFYDPATSAADKAKLRQEIDALEAEKAQYSSNRPPAPGSTLSNSTPPNAGTSGTNNAASGNNQPGTSTGNQNSANTNNRTSGNPTGAANGNPNNGPQPGGNSGGGQQGATTNQSSTTGGATGSNPGSNTGSNQSTSGTQSNTNNNRTTGNSQRNTNSNSNTNNGNQSSGNYSRGSSNNNSYNNASGGNSGNSNQQAAPGPHEVLGIDKDATFEEAKRAYRKATLKNHPDRGGSEEMQQKINAAWAAIQKDPRYANQANQSSSTNQQNTSATGNPNQRSRATTNDPQPTAESSAEQPSSSTRPAARSTDLLNGITGNSDRLAPRSTTTPVGTVSMATPQSTATLGNKTATPNQTNQAPAVVALNPTTGTGLAIEPSGTVTPLQQVNRTLGDGNAQPPSYSPAQQERILNKAIAAQDRVPRPPVTQSAQPSQENPVTAPYEPVVDTTIPTATTPVPEKIDTILPKKIVPQNEAPVIPIPPVNENLITDDIQAQKIVADQDKIVEKNIKNDTSSIPVPPINQTPIKEDVQAQQIAQDQDKTVEKNIDKELTSMQQTSLYAGTENLKDSIQKAARNLNNSDSRFAFIDDQTGQKLNTATGHLDNFLSSVQEGNIDTEHLHKALTSVSQALKESTNGQRPRGINSEHLENEHRTISDLHSNLEENLGRISASLPEGDKQNIRQKSNQILNDSSSIKSFLQNKKNILSDY